MSVEELYACDLVRAWLWTHGHVDRRKFKGECLSGLHRRAFDTDFEPEEIIRADVEHGWVWSVAGDVEGCGWDSTTYFDEAEPQIVDGCWGAREVVDGPHTATWLVPT